MSGYPDFADGAIVVSTVQLFVDDVILHAGFVGQVAEQDGPWLKLEQNAEAWMATHFRLATPEEAEAFAEGLLAFTPPAAPAQDTSNPLRPMILYTDPALPDTEEAVLISCSSGLRDLHMWLEDERRLVLDLRRQLAALQDENAELRGALQRQAA